MNRLAFSLVALLSACVPALPAALGDQCQLTSDCDAPLVCRIGSCRKECATDRDCAAGTDCILDSNKLGACQLPNETHCALASDCPSPLTCSMTRCVNVCTTDRDCPPGNTCVGGTACVDQGRMSCVYNSDCAAFGTSICAPDQRCRDECTRMEDCRYGQICDSVTLPGGETVNFCQFAESDAGTAPVDAGTD